MNCIIQSSSWQTDREALMRIRDKVFIQEQKVSLIDEWDDKDETATHFIVSLANGSAIACARVLCEDNLYHIGRVAVLAEYRNQTIGRQLMQFILSWCQEQKTGFKIYLHAQTSRIAFYEHLDFVAEGDVFMDAGIEHIEMWFTNTK
jgi:predicted GNAT family N-acyltransferase